MSKRTVSGITLTLLLIGMLTAFNVPLGFALTRKITVPDDYPTIQEAINQANDGDTIFVRNGTYHEHVFVNKAVSLVGENRSTTIIDGDGVGTIIHVGGVDSFNISDFTIKNGSQGVVAWGNCNISNNRILSNKLQGLLLGGENNIITHNKISNMHDGIYIRFSRHSKIVCNDVMSNGRCGIWSGSSVDLLIANNTFSKNSKGIWASTGTDATIVNNTISHNSMGLILYCAGGSFLANNNITQNDYNLRVEGESLSDFELDMDTSNTVNGRSVYYLVRKKDVLIDSSTYPNVGYLGVVDSKNVTVQDLSFTGNYEGVLCAYTTDSMIRNVTATNHWSGIYLRSSDRNEIVGNEISSAIWGIYIVRCQNNSIEDNTISGNVRGLYYAYCDHNVVSHNIVRNNSLGIFLDSTINNTLFGNVIDYNKYSFGVVGQQLKHFFHRIDTSNLVEGKPIYYFINRKNLTVNSLTYPEIGYLALVNSTGAIIENVTMTNSYNGVLLAYTNDSRLTGNTITNSMFSVYLYYSYNNTIYHNNFIDNRYSSQCFQSLNAWDDGYPSGGNYWSDYTGVDVKSGPNQDQPGSDGIRDTPYVIDENNQDNYPFMDPNGWLLHQLTQLTVTSSPVTGITFNIDGNPQTTPYTAWLLEGSYTLEMPETYNGYVWSHWLEDGDPNRTKTITLPSTTWTGVFVFAVEPHGPEAEFTVTPDTASIDESIKFDASASLLGWNGTHEMPIVEYRWDFGDGNKTTTSNTIVYHSFSSSGIYYVTLTVYAPGATPDADSTTKKVTITAIPVGGYSFPINPYTTEKPLAFYLALLAILTTVSTAIKRKTRRSTKR